QAMMNAITEHFPADVHITESEGGMFLWATLPENMSAMRLFDHAIKEKVAFVPGKPFYVSSTKDKPVPDNTLRLSYVTMDEDRIHKGIQILGACLRTRSLS
ncbi:MAG: PLP-dependent aminotransferase family protein, partial [Sulfurovum sp.]